MRRCTFIVMINTAAALIGSAPPSIAYEQDTHRIITRTAFEKSVLNKSYPEEELGFIRNSLLQGLRVLEWLEEGSVGEDDISLLSLRPIRPGHHFYDPVFNRGLTHRCFSGFRAVEWALEDPEEIVGQSFSWRDARRYFLDALTLEQPAAREEQMALTFRTLGQVMHLVQDMGSPEHTRNDPHAGINLFGAFLCGAPSLFEDWINQKLDTFSYDRYSSPPFSQLRQFWATGDGRGFAEFTNRSFISKSTNFTRTEDGATGGGYPEPRLRLGLRTDEDIRSLIPGTPLQGVVTFFGNNIVDVNTGDIIHNSRMTTYSLFDSAIAKRGQQEIFSINRFTVEAAGQILLPRATGYSAALLDYFFRAKLDVDLVDDPSGPGGVQLIGTNASAEPLINGVLAVYADTPAGNRALAVPSGVPVVGVDPGGSLPPVSLTAPEGAERFVAVYQGTLGNEVKDPARNFPGAVIGKVLGGVRVEEIFSDGTEWKIRTPKGVFGFEPRLQTSEYELAKWGDARDLFVARTPFGQDQPNRVAVFEVTRVTDSVELVTVDTPGGLKVPVRLVRLATLPEGGIATGTVVNFRQTSFQRQTIIKTEVRTTFTCEVDPDTGRRSTRLVSQDNPIPEILDQAPVTAEFARVIPVVLDPAHHFSDVVVVPDYAWFLSDVSVDSEGRMLGLALVFGLDPAIAPFPFPVYGIDKDTGGVVAIGQSFLLPRYPQGSETFLWALVDLGARQTIMTTAESTIVLSQTMYHQGTPDIWHRTIATGGCDLPSPRTSATRVFGPGRIDTDVIVTTGQFQERVGEDDIVIAGLLRADLRATLAGAGFAESQVSTIERTSDFVYDCTTDTPRMCRALQLHSRFSGAGRNPAFLEDARRPPKAAVPERIVLLARDYTIAGTPLGSIAVLETGSGRTAVRQQVNSDFVTLWDVSSALALVTEETLSIDFGFFEPSTTLVSLDGSRAPVVFSGALLNGSFTVLDPSYLYNPGDMKFYRLQAPLTRTALPAALADVAGNPTGSYHAIRLP